MQLRQGGAEQSAVGGQPPLPYTLPYTATGRSVIMRTAISLRSGAGVPSLARLPLQRRNDRNSHAWIPRSRSESSSGCATLDRTRANLSAPGIDPDAARQGPVRVRGRPSSRLLSDRLHHFAAVRDGGRCLGGDFGGGQRGADRGGAVHGRRDDTEP